MLAPFAWLSIAPMLAGASPSPISHSVVQPQTIVHFAVSDTGTSKKDSTKKTVLTQEMLTRCIAVRKDLMLYWESHADLRNAADATVHKMSLNIGGRSWGFGVLDYPALAAKDTALAGIFKRNKFTPQQFEPTIVATFQALGIIAAGENPPDPATVAGKNFMLVKAHRQELRDVGIDINLKDDDDSGGGFMGG